MAANERVQYDRIQNILAERQIPEEPEAVQRQAHETETIRRSTASTYDKVLANRIGKTIRKQDECVPQADERRVGEREN